MQGQQPVTGMASEGCAGPKLTFGGGPQRIRSRKQSVPQRSCVDSGEHAHLQPCSCRAAASLCFHGTYSTTFDGLLLAIGGQKGSWLISDATRHCASLRQAALKLDPGKVSWCTCTTIASFCVCAAIINPTQPNQTLLPASLDSNPAAPVQHSELLEATPFSSGPLLVENAGLHAAAAAAAASHAAQWAGKASATSKKSEGTPKGSKDAPRPLKQGLCSFCSETWSPMWRRGPEQYPRLCNACGMR